MKTSELYARLPERDEKFCVLGDYLFLESPVATDPAATRSGPVKLWVDSTRYINCLTMLCAAYEWTAQIGNHYSEGGLTIPHDSAAGLVSNAESGIVTHRFTRMGGLCEVKYMGQADAEATVGAPFNTATWSV